MKTLQRRLLTLLLIAPALAAADMPSYQIVSLGSFGGDLTLATDLNESGQVTGSANFVPFGSNHAFLYTGVRLVDLGDLGGDGSNASALNERGDVVGSAPTPNGTEHAFLYLRQQRRMVDVGTLSGPGGGSTQAGDVNDRRQVTGISATDPSGAERHAFLYTHQPRSMLDLGTLGGSVSIGQYINASGQVAGSYNTDDSHAFRYDPASGSAVDLVPGRPSFVNGPSGRAINRRGHVLGTFLATDGVYHGFIYRDGNAVDLGALSSSQNFGVLTFAINNRDEATGQIFNAANQSHAFLYSHGVLRDLGVVEGTRFNFGIDINDSGEVTGATDTMPFVFTGGKMVKIDLAPLGAVSGEPVRINNAGQVAGNYFTQDPDSGNFVERAFLATPISLLLSRLGDDARNRDAGLANAAHQALAQFKAQAHEPTCQTLSRFLSRAQELAARQPNASFMPLISDANAVRGALNCTTRS